ncbi:MAG: hypothetical protein HY825_18130 [Acidobacteria bacterium]|nr:hypothetical protein [Acidobacteriota bacterium]
MTGRPSRVEVTVRQGALVLQAVANRLGHDLVVAIGGGDRPHVGCAVLAQPHPSTADPERSSSTVSTLVIPPHRDDAIARTVADTLARGLGVVVLAAAGVHTDDLDASGISTYRRLARRLADRLLAALRDRS